MARILELDDTVATMALNAIGGAPGRSNPGARATAGDVRVLDGAPGGEHILHRRRREFKAANNG
ncbi:hypothetical protein [Nocardia sp. MW-W600-9]